MVMSRLVRLVALVFAKYNLKWLEQLLYSPLQVLLVEIVIYMTGRVGFR